MIPITKSGWDEVFSSMVEVSPGYSLFFDLTLRIKNRLGKKICLLNKKLSVLNVEVNETGNMEYVIRNMVTCNVIYAEIVATDFLNFNSNSPPFFVF